MFAALDKLLYIALMPSLSKFSRKFQYSKCVSKQYLHPCLPNFIQSVSKFDFDNQSTSPVARALHKKQHIAVQYWDLAVQMITSRSRECSSQTEKSKLKSARDTCSSDTRAKSTTLLSPEIGRILLLKGRQREKPQLAFSPLAKQFRNVQRLPPCMLEKQYGKSEKKRVKKRNLKQTHL